MKQFCDEHLRHVPLGSAVLDAGSREYKKQGSYRPLFKGYAYRGMDVKQGANVDTVVAHPEKWTEFEDGEFPVVISGQMLEHTERPWIVFKELARVLANGGVMCVIVPWKWIEHRYPIDCWRILPDGMRVLASEADLMVLDTFIDNNDCVGVFAKR